MHLKHPRSLSNAASSALEEGSTRLSCHRSRAWTGKRPLAEICQGNASTVPPLARRPKTFCPASCAVCRSTPAGAPELSPKAVR